MLSRTGRCYPMLPMCFAEVFPLSWLIALRSHSQRMQDAPARPTNTDPDACSLRGSLQYCPPAFFGLYTCLSCALQRFRNHKQFHLGNTRIAFQDTPTLQQNAAQISTPLIALRELATRPASSAGPASRRQ